jgi:RNA polymerase sigma factor (sigma-70 family)
MEVSALKYPAGVGRYGRSPLLRIQSDEHLIKLIRAGHDGAFEVIVSRYDTRLLSFCRHLLGSREDAEDVLQEAFSAAYHAMLADDRAINVRPWLYRIARNRCLNHLRRIPAVPTDSMDVLYAENGETTADKVHRREEFRLLVGDIHELPETQRTALLLREMDALSYEQIAEAMETTVSSVKSLLVRARVSLAEASEARLLSCEDVRGELGEVAEGLTKRPSTLVRRHLKNCERCVAFNHQLRRTNRALGALLPLGPLALLKGGLLVHLTGQAGHGAATATGSAATAGASSGMAGSGAVAGVAGVGASSGAIGAAAGSTSGWVGAGIGALATKAAAGLAVAAVVTAGVAVSHHPTASAHRRQVAAIGAGARPARGLAVRSQATRSTAATAGHRPSAPGVHAATLPTASATHAAAVATPAPHLTVRHSTAGPAQVSPSSIAAAATGAIAAATTPSRPVASSATAGADSPDKGKRHGTKVSTSGAGNQAGSQGLLTLGTLTEPASAPQLPSLGGSSSSGPGAGSSASGGSSSDSDGTNPVSSALSQIVATVTGGSSSTPGA